jgi:hypothetical protein
MYYHKPSKFQSYFVQNLIKTFAQILIMWIQNLKMYKNHLVRRFNLLPFHERLHNFAFLIIFGSICHQIDFGTLLPQA